ncbi:MAG: aminoglycoside phosphotransferase family protein [Chloroflexi bacterium]|nr:aminoglycoside phosphotransferase family protein [Chloroflexota bacterium]
MNIETGYPALADYLAVAEPRLSMWQGWHIQRIPYGHNGIVYRATCVNHDVAVKFTKRDARHRAGREYQALQTLERFGLHVAPAPLWLETERYPQPVVVQTWLDGDVCTGAPASLAGWEALMRHYAIVHAGIPEKAEPQLPPAVVSLFNAQDGIDRIRRQVRCIPERAVPVELKVLMALVECAQFPVWTRPTAALCRCDPNITNFIRQPFGWASVDWENSGWGDPAFEIGDLMAHPAYQSVPLEQWDGVVKRYCDMRADTAAGERIWVYYTLTLGWWAALYATIQYKLANGIVETRLVDRPAGWAEQVPANYARYLAAATRATKLFG